MALIMLSVWADVIYAIDYCHDDLRVLVCKFLKDDKVYDTILFYAFSFLYVA